ncbi:hypothetical protein [Paraburkholderia sp. EG304]|uniref:hypothetical protein n=1 Tax=Paraburkholderia sp. EG304 TaxID=3237015 RepID=UPI00397A32E6
MHFFTDASVCCFRRFPTRRQAGTTYRRQRQNRPFREKLTAPGRIMLSPHEFAVLMLVKASPECTDIEREEFNAVLGRQLVALESTPSGAHRPRVTNHGESLLQTLMRKR